MIIILAQCAGQIAEVLSQFQHQAKLDYSTPKRPSNDAPRSPFSMHPRGKKA